jgi:monovalent cation/hydrogen antiporter
VATLALAYVGNGVHRAHYKRGQGQLSGAATYGISVSYKNIMIEILQLLVGLLLVIAAVAFIANRLEVPPSILLVLAGVGLALPSALPRVELSPEVVLLLVLPPIIYSASVAMSWSEFRSNLRPISLLAVGCVVFTATAVAAAAHYWMGFSWQLGFVLGAIVSPPHAVAPLAAARRLQLPRRIVGRVSSRP